MNKLSAYGVLGKQEEAQLLAEIRLHPDLPITSEIKRDITEGFAGKGISVLSVQVHREAAFELA